jgi:hypothetical protein
LLQPSHPSIYVGSQWSFDDERSEQAEGITTLDQLKNDGDDEFENLPLGMGIEDFLESEAVLEEPSSTNNSDNFLMVDNKKYMKASVVTVWLSSKCVQKLTVHTL